MMIHTTIKLYMRQDVISSLDVKLYLNWLKKLLKPIIYNIARLKNV
jgi:hypothetical protein